MPFSSLTRTALFLILLSISLNPAELLAWGYQGHRMVGSIADQLLKDTNAAKQIQTILNDGDAHGPLTLRLVGPWADCVKSVQLQDDGSLSTRCRRTNASSTKCHARCSATPGRSTSG